MWASDARAGAGGAELLDNDLRYDAAVACTDQIFKLIQSPANEAARLSRILQTVLQARDEAECYPASGRALGQLTSGWLDGRHSTGYPACFRQYARQEAPAAPPASAIMARRTPPPMSGGSGRGRRGR
jgi:hypothetical protein